MDVTLWMVGIIVLAWIVAPHPEYLEKTHQWKDALGLPYLLGSSIELILYNTISWILLGTLFERVVIGRPYHVDSQGTWQLGSSQTWIS